MNGDRKYRNGRHSKVVRHNELAPTRRRRTLAGRRSLHTECRGSDTRQINNSTTGASDTLNRHSKYILLLSPSLSL